MSQDIRNLGTYANIAALWEAHPEGGREGDYATVSGTRYRWNKYDRIWENGATVTQTTGTKNHVVEGNQEVTGDVTVLGTLNAKHVKQPHMGMYASEEALLAALPTPEKGWYALVGNELPAELYVCNTAGTWTDTGNEYDGESVDLTEYVKTDVFQDYTNRGYKILGEATPDTIPSSPSKGDAYLASTAGTYTNFGGTTLADGQMAMFKYNGSAWSAGILQVGKSYDSEIEQLGDRVARNAIRTDLLDGTFTKTEQKDVSSLGVRNYNISSEGVYGSSNTYKHSIVAVQPGRIVRIGASETNLTRFCFVKTNASPVSNGAIPLCTGCVVETVAAGATRLFFAPEDAAYFLVYRGAGSEYPYSPSSIEIVSPAFEEEGTIHNAKPSDIASVNLVSDAIVKGLEYETETIDISEVAEQDLSIASTNEYNSTGKHAIIEVYPGAILKVVGGGGRVAFVSGIWCPNSGSTYGQIETYTLKAGETYLLRAPSGAQAFIFNTYEGQTYVAPTSIEVSTPVEGRPTFRVLGCGRFAPGSTLSYAAYASSRNVLVKVKAGHYYTFKYTGNAAVSCFFIEDLPRIGLAATSQSFSVSSNTIDKQQTTTLTPETDGYYIFRVYKSSGPSIELSVYDTDWCRETVPVGEFKDYWREASGGWTKRSYMIDTTSGLYGASTSYKHILFPVRRGMKVKFVQGSNSVLFAWFTEKDTPSANGVPPYVPGTGIIRTTGGVYEVPEGANWLYVYYGSSTGANWPSFIAMSVDYGAMPDIVVENDYEKTRRLLFQLKSTTRAENDVPYKPLVLLHYSDIHGRETCQKRINEFREFFADYIDDTIQTGDLVTSYWADGIAFGDETDPDNNPCKDILSVIGNHDLASKSGGDFVWHTYQGKQAYDRYIGPYVENWGVVQPTGAEENGYCFYYKDYAASKIRLVAIDAFNNNSDYQAAQQAWFADVLADAITEGLSVIVASHFRIKCESLLRSPFTCPGAAVENPDSSVCNEPYVPLVKDFIDNGGKFVCWITGHSHYDAISKTSEEQGNQINICVNRAGAVGSTATSLWETNSRINVDFSDWKTFDCFNVMAIDTYYKFITLFRVGSNWDKMGRKVETCCIKYDTGEILYP